MKTTPNMQHAIIKHQEEIRAFVVSNFMIGEAGDLQNGTSFLEADIMDSTGILELITFLETTYDIKVQDSEMLPENLDSVSRVVRFVERKLNEKTDQGQACK